MIGSAALGAIVTVVAGSNPGIVLCFFLVIGTIGAALAVKPRAVYKIIPVPVLAYLVAALIAGMIHNGAAGSSLTSLALGAAQWIASGFIAMIVATLLVIAIALGRLRGSDSGRSSGPRRSSGPGKSSGTGSTGDQDMTSGPGSRPTAAGPGRSRRPPLPGPETARRPPVPGADTARGRPAPGADTVRLPQVPEPGSTRRAPSARAWPGAAEPGTREDFPASAAFRDYGSD